jgi:ABC-type multidrug transport system ATPase subunit
MDEAAQCDRIALMQEGRIMEVSTPGMILSGFSAPLFELRTTDRLGAIELLRSLKEIRRAYLFGQGIHLTTDAANHGAEWISAQLLKYGISDFQIEPSQADFEDCFIKAVEQRSA